MGGHPSPPGDPDGRAGAAADAPASVASPWRVRLFGSRAFFRLWLAQVASATGDWLGLSAVILLAAKVGGAAGAGAGAGAISIVLAARIVPGFLFGPVAGVLVDRWDRRQVMIACDLGRALVVACLPFVNGLGELVLASLVLEMLTLLWAPAKDASVPRLVPPAELATANSWSLAAAYGTFPFATLLFAVLAGASQLLEGVPHLGFLTLDQMALAFYVDAATFVTSALIIRSLDLGRTRRRRVVATRVRARMRDTWIELREGWQEIFANPTVRAVNLGLATGLVGGGMLIPLGAVYATEVLHAGPAGYGLFTTALGFGVALGAIGVCLLQRRVAPEAVFTSALLIAGVILIVAASATTLGGATVAVGLMGVAVGPVYVEGFVLLQQEVDDELRGRVFSSLNTLVRVCVLFAMVAGPLLSAALGNVSSNVLGGTLVVGDWHLAVPGVRLTLWLAGLIIVVAGVLASRSVRVGLRSKAFHAGHHPSQRPFPIGGPALQDAGGA
jgi:dTMP kinase